MLSIFEKMGKICREDGAFYEIAIYGGSALMLAFDMLAKFYPGQELPVRNRLILEDVFEAKRQSKPYSPMMGW